MAELPNSAPNVLDQKVMAKIDGQEVEVSVKDILAEYQKGRTADRRLAEIAAKEKDFQKTLAIGEEMLKARAGDPDALRRGFAHMGFSENEIQEYFTALESAAKPPQNQPNPAPNGQNNGANQPPPAQIDIAALYKADPSLAKAKVFIDKLEKQGFNIDSFAEVLGTTTREKGQDNLRKIISDRISLDPDLKKAILANNGNAEAFVSLADSTLKRRLLESGQRLTEDQLDAAIKEMKSNVEKLPLNTEPKDPLLSLGMLGESVGLNATDHRERMTKQPPTTSAAFDDFVTQRLQDNFREAAMKESEP